MFYRAVVQRSKAKHFARKTYSSPKRLHRIFHRPVNLLHLELWIEFSFPSPPRSLQHYQCTIQALQDELRIQRDLNQLLQSDYSESGFLGNQSISPQDMTEENFLRLHGEYERQVKELFLLRKTVEEMELRIDTQKHTLTAR